MMVDKDTHMLSKLVFFLFSLFYILEIRGNWYDLCFSAICFYLVYLLKEGRRCCRKLQ